MVFTKKFIITDRSDCILCASCSSLAPGNFDVLDTGSTVSKQPQHDEEVKNCYEALNSCPMNIIAAI